MITGVPPICSVGNSWLLQPVTWNSGTEIRLRSCVVGDAGLRTRSRLLDRKFSWVVIAPFGNPVVPLV